MESFPTETPKSLQIVQRCENWEDEGRGFFKQKPPDEGLIGRLSNLDFEVLFFDYQCNIQVKLIVDGFVAKVVEK